MEYWAKYRFASRTAPVVCSSGSIETDSLRQTTTTWCSISNWGIVMVLPQCNSYKSSRVVCIWSESLCKQPFNISFVSSWPVLIQTSLELYRLWSVMSNNAFICFSDQHSYFKHGTACHPTCIKSNAGFTILKRS